MPGTRYNPSVSRPSFSMKCSAFSRNTGIGFSVDVLNEYDGNEFLRLFSI